MKKAVFKTLNPSDLTNKICVVVGTRPGIIKMSPLIVELQKRKVPFFVIHTGQHYSLNMDRQFFSDLDLPQANYRVNWGKRGGYHGEQTATMLKGIERVLLKEKPQCVLVCGDANTNLAGALAARKLNIAVGHVESGLRSRDWRMPEEHNRVMIDHISDYLFAPTSECVHNLKRENVQGKIILSGNTIVDSVKMHRSIAKRKSLILNKLNISSKKYLLFTSHREENVDSSQGLAHIVDIIKALTSSFDLKLIFPVHPRTLKNLTDLNLLKELNSLPGIILSKPLGYLDFLVLIEKAATIITDSGGIQEESCILKTPCVTIRDNTERPETLKVGANIIVGLSRDKVVSAVQKSIIKKRDWNNPFGDGHAARLIIQTIIGNG